MTRGRQRVRRGAVLVVLTCTTGSTIAAAATEAWSQSGSYLASVALEPARARRWQLPPSLREISGLATVPGNHVITHNDERAVLHELDPAAGAVVKTFALVDRGSGRGVTTGDFEGIAAAGERLYLVTSDGDILETSAPTGGIRAPFTAQRTGIGKRCEVEGLAYDGRARALLLACKQPRDPTLRDFVTIFRWSLEQRRLEEPPLRIAEALFTRPLGTKRFHPSAIEWIQSSGNYLLVASVGNAIAEVATDGRVVSVSRLPKSVHAQPEGVTILDDGSLVIADEGDAKRGATLTIYPRRP